jgi:hypothetical protein
LSKFTDVTVVRGSGESCDVPCRLSEAHFGVGKAKNECLDLDLLLHSIVMTRIVSLAATAVCAQTRRNNLNGRVYIMNSDDTLNLSEVCALSLTELAARLKF